MIKNKTYIYMFFIAIISLFVIFASDKIAYVLSLFAPIVYAGVIAYLMDGMVRILLRYTTLKRGVCIFLVIVLVLLLCGVTFYYTIPFLVDTVKDLVNYVSTLLSRHDTGIYNLLEDVCGYLNIDINSIYRFDITKIDKNLIDTFSKAVNGVYGITLGTVTKVGSSVVILFTSFVLAIYMLIEKEDLLYRMKRLVRACVSEKNEKYVLDAFTMSNDVFKKFIIGKSIDSLIIGLLMIVFFMIFGIEYGVVFGILGGIGNMIPYFGPFLSAVPVVVILLIINPWHAVVALIIILAVQQLDSHVITPKVLSDNIGGVSAFWILFSVTVCGIAFGFMGMIFGVPLVVIIKNLVESFVESRLKDRKISKKPDSKQEVKKDAEES